MLSRKIQAVFLDWAGTVVDHGSVAPVKALEESFATFGVRVARPVIRRYMGLAKKDHIRKLLEEPEVGMQWAGIRGSTATEADVEEIYAGFEPQMMEALAGYAAIIPGAVDAVAWMRERGMKIAGTTGYTRAMLDQLQELAGEQGLRMDASLAPEDVGAGRPCPFMCYRLASDLGIYPLWACVKIGDTESDIAEGLNAGMWTIGVTRSGNSVGLSEADWLALDAAQQAELMVRAEAELQAAGAHFTAETVAHTLAIFDVIEQRMAAGEGPR